MNLISLKEVCDWKGGGLEILLPHRPAIPIKISIKAIVTMMCTYKIGGRPTRMRSIEKSWERSERVIPQGPSGADGVKSTTL